MSFCVSQLLNEIDLDEFQIEVEDDAVKGSDVGEIEEVRCETVNEEVKVIDNVSSREVFDASFTSGSPIAQVELQGDESMKAKEVEVACPLRLKPSTDLDFSVLSTANIMGLGDGTTLHRIMYADLSSVSSEDTSSEC